MHIANFLLDMPNYIFHGHLRLKIAIIIHNPHHRLCFFSSVQHHFPNKKLKLSYWSDYFSLPQHQIHLNVYKYSNSWTLLYVQIHLTTSLSASYHNLSSRLSHILQLAYLTQSFPFQLILPDLISRYYFSSPLVPIPGFTFTVQHCSVAWMYHVF